MKAKRNRVMRDDAIRRIFLEVGNELEDITMTTFPSFKRQTLESEICTDPHPQCSFSQDNRSGPPVRLADRAKHLLVCDQLEFKVFNSLI
jgi:hypothetical protein